MTVLLDTDVLVDYLRGTAGSRSWLANESTTEFAIPGIVAMELVAGCRSQAELVRTQKFVHSFPILWPEADEFARAYDLMAAHHLSSGLSIPDAVIASMALVRSARLYTFNIKHYRIVAGLDVAEPYVRS